MMAQTRGRVQRGQIKWSTLSSTPRKGVFREGKQTAKTMQELLRERILTSNRLEGHDTTVEHNLTEQVMEIF